MEEYNTRQNSRIENGKKWDEPGKPMPVRKKNVTRMHAYQREQARHLRKAQEGLAKFEMIRNEQSYETGNSVVDATVAKLLKDNKKFMPREGRFNKELDTRERNIMKLGIKKIGELVEVETKNFHEERLAVAKRSYQRLNRDKVQKHALDLYYSGDHLGSSTNSKFASRANSLAATRKSFGEKTIEEIVEEMPPPPELKGILEEIKRQSVYDLY